MRKLNKVVRLSLHGGLIGLFLTNPRRALDNEIDKHNQEGWNAHQIVPHAERNLLAMILQLLVLFLTLFLWTWGAGYLILLEKEASN